MKIVFIGAGNVATHLAPALQAVGHDIAQIYSRTESNACALAQLLNSKYTTNISEIVEADLYFYTLADHALPTTIQGMKTTTGIHVHTAGSVPMEIFGAKFQKHGVFYPLQTFSKNKKVSFEQIPIFVEANTAETTQTLLSIAKCISEKTFPASSTQRIKIHIAAVFACNFTNYFYTIASELTENEAISFDILHPLIAETAEKIKTIKPYDAQTGPARRNDKTTIENHLKILQDEKLRLIYELISNQIKEKY